MRAGLNLLSLNHLERLAVCAAVVLLLSTLFAFAAPCPDADGDGEADCTVPGCDPSGLLCGDCDDADGSVNTGETEVCNHKDDDCDGLVDEGFSRPTTFRSFADVADGVASDAHGISLAILGDVDGDGIDDILVGVYLDDNASGTNAGSVLLYSGTDRSILCRAVDNEGAGSDYLGFSVAALNDVDGDGTNDFVAGAYLDDTNQGGNAGSVSVFSGADCSRIRKMVDTESAANDYLGISVAGLDDINGDGVMEVIAGASLADPGGVTDAGRVVVFDPTDGSVIHRLDDPAGAGSDQMGLAVADAGDVDGDGTHDIAAGAYLDDAAAGSNAGSVVLFSGSSGSFIRKLEDSGGAGSDQLGIAVLGIDDIDGDGTNDLAAGAFGDDAGRGSVVIFDRTDGSVIRKLTDPDAAGSDNLGYSLAHVGDLTGDGIGEVLAGSYRDDTAGGNNAGSVLLFDPTDGTVLAKEAAPGGATNDKMGRAVASTDVSGDGAPDFLAGIPNAESAEEVDVGRVLIISFEADCDGDGQAPFDGDCDDDSAVNFTGNTEVCDSFDNDCDGTVDEDDDGDGVDLCTDCEPHNPLVYPGAPERCNGVDDDCDGSVDEGEDLDGDGFEEPCDCDDGDATINPGNAETCDRTDQDCDGQIDEDFAQPTTFRDVSDVADGAPADAFGTSTAVIRDVNGDGIDDILVGLYLDDNGGGTNAGGVLLFAGGSYEILCRAVDPEGGGSDYLGFSVAVIGDVDGDGTDDFAAGAYLDDTNQGGNAGSVSLFSGADCSRIRKLRDLQSSANDYLGISVARLRDINGDGVDEVIAGAYLTDTARGNDAGRVVVFDPTDGSVVHRMEDPFGRPSDQLGRSVADAGDVDFDGTHDVAAGAHLDNTLRGSNSGSVTLFSGATGQRIRKLTDSDGADSDQLGITVLAIDDLTGDDVPELAAGAWGDNAGRGSITIFNPVDGTSVQKLTDIDGAGSDNLGRSLATITDVTGDGIREVVSGAYRDDTASGNNAGSVLVFDPTDGSIEDKLTDPDGATNDELGTAVATGDVTGDGGGPDIVVGAPNDESAEEFDVGKVVIISYESDCDGDGKSPFGTDCDDGDSNLFTGNPESCDGQDNDCDGTVDEDDDGDGFDVCTDCAVDNPRVYPGAGELCNLIDDDCDGSVDEGEDLDGDGFEEPCDCDDTDGSINSGATEVCNRLDDDCDSLVDESLVGPEDILELTDPGRKNNDVLGRGVAGVGDVNGDRVPDFAVGAYLDDNAQGTNAGQVIVYSGADRSEWCRLTDPEGAGSDYFGYALTGMGDLDGDGTDDIAVGSYLDDTNQGGNAGSVSLFSGADCSRIRKLTDLSGAANDYLGFAVARLHDITGDGVDELIAGVHLSDTTRGNDAGRAVVFDPTDGSVVHRLEDPFGRGSDHLGRAVADAGDVDFDGTHDIAAGADLDNTLRGSNSGSVTLFSGATGDRIRKLIDSDGAGSDQLGVAVLRIDDLTGDGVGELAAGAWGDSSSRGSVTIFDPVDGSALRKLTDPDGGGSDNLGVSLAPMADMTGDGIGEVIAGAYRDDTPQGNNAGSILIFDPTDGSVIDKKTKPDGAANDEYGTTVALIGDIFFGGTPEILVGVPQDDVDGTVDAGSAVFYSFDEGDCDVDGTTPLQGDCADGNPDIPGVEICDDGLDNDCDGHADVADTECNAPCPDDDGDDYAVCGPECDLASGDTCGDCDDTDAGISPDGTETPDDGIDQDCNGADTITCFVDGDQDGFGSSSTTLAADGSCDTVDGESDNDLDCNDGNAAINPNAAEVCDDGLDNDCDGSIDIDDPDCALPDCPDADNDDWAVCDAGCTPAEGDTCGDCDDSASGTNPGATETPDDGIDQDCNGFDTITCIVDGDQDGFGTDAGTTTLAPDGACDTAEGESDNDLDCDDGNASINPNGTEVPDDGIDQDCNGFDTITCIVDGDQDGFGTDAGTTTLAPDGTCDTAQGESATSDDCNDGSAAVNPGAAEVCDDGIDNECDGLTDAADPDCALPDCPDVDNDDWAVCDASCNPASGDQCGDCDDGDAGNNPAADEICIDGEDNDCDGLVDTADPDCPVDPTLPPPGSIFTSCAAPPTFSWPADGDQKFKLIFANNPNMTGLLKTSGKFKTATSWTPSLKKWKNILKNLTGAGDSTIYWAIIGKSGSGETQRPPSYFILPAQESAMRLTPGEGESFTRDDGSAPFSWTSGTCNTKYRLLFSRDPNFQVPEFKIPGKGKITSTSFLVKGKQWKNKVARTPGTVYWRILAIDNIKRETTSSIYSIEITP